MIRVSDEVRAALGGGRPVVALESTVPATVAVLAGAPTIGLSTTETERIATADAVLKLSTRDLPVAAARGRDGATTVAATTVAATMWLAHRVGVRVFATGGIGGVHRGVRCRTSRRM